MTARDFAGSVSSLGLMLAAITLCLLFAICDRLTEPAPRQARARRGPRAAGRPMPALGPR